VAGNQLYYGDNLDILRRYVRDESVDLIYSTRPSTARRRTMEGVLNPRTGSDLNFS
jgi:hypothetical protein